MNNKKPTYTSLSMHAPTHVSKPYSNDSQLCKIGNFIELNIIEIKEYRGEPTYTTLYYSAADLKVKVISNTNKSMININTIQSIRKLSKDDLSDVSEITHDGMSRTKIKIYGDTYYIKQVEPSNYCVVTCINGELIVKHKYDDIKKCLY